LARGDNCRYRTCNFSGTNGAIIAPVPQLDSTFRPRNEKRLARLVRAKEPNRNIQRRIGMETVTLIRVVAIGLAFVLVGVIVYRHKKAAH
jgi:hypothetical protein